MKALVRLSELADILGSSLGVSLVVKFSNVVSRDLMHTYLVSHPHNTFLDARVVCLKFRMEFDLW